MPTESPRVTLWFLNRVVDWGRDESLRAQLIAATAAGAGISPSEVRLGQRLTGTTEASTAGTTTADQVGIPCNFGSASHPGELMHERPGEAVGDFDEYFVPIALKCLGLPVVQPGLDILPQFWLDRVNDEARRERLRDIFRATANACFDPAHSDQYFPHANALPLDAVEKSGCGSVCTLANGKRVPPWQEMFADVKLNLTKDFWEGGYYKILTEAKATHGDNVLIGYSQCGLVAAFLAFIDEELVDEEARCVARFVAIQAPLRGSPLATPKCAESVMEALVAAIVALRPRLLMRVFLRNKTPPGLRRFVEQVLVTRKLQVQDLNRAIDLAWTQTNPKQRLTRDTLRTARKWLSGLSGPPAGAPPLAFAEIDCGTLSEDKTVLGCLAAHAGPATPQGAVIGCGSGLHELAADMAVELGWIPDRLRGPVRWMIWPFVQRSHTAWRTQAHDLAPAGLQAPHPGAQLQRDWAQPQHVAAWRLDPAQGLPERSCDLIIPAASQVIAAAPGATGLLGNLVNRDASHITGALLADAGPRDLAMVVRLLGQR